MTPPIPVVLRPRKLRLASWVAAPVVVIVFVVLSFALTGSTGDQDSASFQRSDQWAMMVLGVIAAAGILVLTRPKVTADAERIVVRNFIGGYDLPWSIVKAVRFDRGSAWANLELADGDVVGVTAVQATDKEYAVAGVRALRALLAAHQTGVGADPAA